MKQKNTYTKTCNTMLIMVIMLLLLSACGCEHKWIDASCTAPKTCVLCAESEGTALLHTWEPATCKTPRTCSSCGINEGTQLSHSASEWIVVSAATQDSVGEKQKVCTHCGVILYTEPVYYYDISQDEKKLYKNVLDTLNSAKAIHANPDSFLLLGAVTNKGNSRTAICFSYAAPDGKSYTEYLWKDVSGNIVKSVFGKDNYLGTASKVYSLDLEEILYFEKTDAYSPELVEVSLDKSWSQYF